MSEPSQSASLSTSARLLLAIPLGISALALGGTLWYTLHDNGRMASGERVAMHFQTACGSQAAAVVRDRAARIGLGEPVLALEAGGFALTATLPGLPGDRAAIPALLARPGTLVLSVGGAAVADAADITGAAVNLDAGGTPYAHLDLNPLAANALRAAITAGGALDLRLDDTVILHQDPAEAPSSDALSVFPTGGDALTQMRTATDWTILLGSGPLPCPVAAGEVNNAAMDPAPLPR